MPSPLSLVLVRGSIGPVGLQGLVAAQPPNAGVDLGLGAGIVVQFLVSVVLYLLLGGALVAIGPHYANDTVADLRDDPVGALGWGLVVGIAGPIVLLILALTIIGLVVAVPGFLLLFVLGLVGNAVTVAWIGGALADTGGELDGYALGVGALALALVGAVPLVGGLLTTLLGLFGLGVVSRNVYASRGGDSDRESGRGRGAVRRREDV